jgi:hypothetical protein
MAQKVNIVIDQGTTFNTDYTFTDENDLPIDFSTYQGRSQMRKTYTSSTSYAFTVSLGNTGIISLSMNAATTSSITAGRYLYDLEVVDSSNVVSRLVEGIVTVTPEITR